jgi:hypothetical protein
VSTIPSRTRQGQRGHARRGVAELIDVAVTGVYPSTTEARQNRAVVSDMKRAMARLASSTILNFASLGSLAQSRPTIDPSIISDDDMAWLLVDAVKSCLTGDERTIVFVELGCGESYLVIKRLLTALLSTRMALPAAILSKLTGWLNGYTGSPEEPQLRMMLAVIRLQQSEAV